MVCPELVRVTDGFLRDRDRKRAYPLPPQGLGWTGKAHESKGFATPPTQPIRKRSEQACTEAGSQPVENSVISRQLPGFGVIGIRIAGDIGPNVARFLVSRIRLDCSSGP
jgi:hypothetical protein